MKQLSCLIIEDEPIAVEILTDYIRQIPYLDLKGAFRKAVDAMGLLQQRDTIDLIFLDLHLPGMKGFEFLRNLSHPPQVIVVSAYHQYALEGYELNVLDYLMKPVTFPRFLRAVQKLKVAPTSGDALIEKERAFFLPENRKKVKVIPGEIIFLESQKDYVTVHLTNGKVITKSTLHNILEQLPEDKFLRIHRSFIVAITKIIAFSNNTIDLPGHSLPIGRNYREQVQQVLTHHLDIR